MKGNKMGYLTDYKLSIVKDDGKVSLKDIKEELEKITYYKFVLCADYLEKNDAKWSSNRKDMIKISKKYPNVVFKLQGNGENIDDFWISYYKNGKSQFAPGVIVYEDYDEGKLE
jgi:hypothetical protein